MKQRHRNNRILAIAIGLALAAPLTAGAAGTETQKSLLDLYRDGGPVMHLIALCSMATMALCSYCALMFRKGKLMSPHIIARLNDLVGQRELPAAYKFCQENPGPLTRALSSALTKANYQRDMYNKTAMENAVADDCFREETKMIIFD